VWKPLVCARHVRCVPAYCKCAESDSSMECQLGMSGGRVYLLLWVLLHAGVGWCPQQPAMQAVLSQHQQGAYLLQGGGSSVQ
jgi:hypothetical protein